MNLERLPLASRLNLSVFHNRPSDVAGIFRENGNALLELGIGPMTHHSLWNGLRVCLQNGDPEDALVIFKAMVRQIETGPMFSCIGIMKDAMTSPLWRLKAIEAAPMFFRIHRTKNSPLSNERECLAANAFQVLALLELNDGFLSYTDTRDMLQALKVVGVLDTREPFNGATALHYAAGHRESASFRAFLEEFSENTNTKSQRDLCPIHFASMLGRSENIKMLIENGADSFPNNDIDNSPMDYAIRSSSITSIMLLLETEKYSDNDVEVLCRKYNGWNLMEELLVYRASLKANQAIVEAGGSSLHPVQPL